MACCFSNTGEAMPTNTEEESGSLLLWILVWSELAAFGALGRFNQPEDVAAAVVFLATPAARQITGTILTAVSYTHLTLPTTPYV